ncbi:MAG TPA: hypothetical protein VLT36_01080, partial [Candidatus Dormibacteraeota bacterium]|nr:hypothetical protein [Candidatus Dormibacteraeota bacterium]
LSSVGTSFHTLKMALYGNTIDVYFDGTRVIHVTDDNVDGIPFYRSGAFGAHMYMYTHYTATFDDYSVSALPGINYPPVLPAQANQNIAPGIALVVTNTATDVDVPANTLTYALQNAPAGAAIGTNGIITWTPTAGQNLTTNLLTTIVTDFNPTATNSQHLSATNSFTVIVNNRAALVPTSTALLLEGCGPTNNAVDPGETVTMGFGFQNVGFANTTNLVATLLSVNGITPISGPQTYGLVAAGGPPTSQAFTFSAGGGCGSTVNATFQMQDGANNLGNVSVPLQLGGFFAESFESASTPGLPAGWTTSASGAELNWITSAFSSSSPPNSAFVPDVANIGTADLISPPIPLPLGASQLSFANSYELETNSANPSEAFDGGVLEIKMGANAFTDILAAGGSFVTNGYTLPISTSWGNPLGGRQAWSGSSGGFLTTIVNLPASAAGQTIQLRWRVGTDSSNGKPGWRIDSVAVLVRSCCVSSGPVLTGQPNRTITELTTLVVTNTATEAGAPPGSLTYALLNAPANAAIDTNGIIAFTPSEAQGPGTNTLTTVVSDNAQPPLSATNSFTVVINESNRPPVLPGQTNRSIVVLSTLSVTNSATDPDIPANALGYSLGAAPTNAAIDANGIITWTPLSFQAPSTNTFTTIVTDSNLSAINSQHLTATNSFQVVVLAIRNPPMLPAQSNRAITEPVTLIVTNQASENDVPTMPLSYQLVNPPTGALIDTNGVITWTPAAGQAPSTNLIETVVTDNPNGPGLTATNSFTVSVQPAPIIPAPVIKGIAVANGKVTLTWSAVSNHTYRVQYKPSLNQSNWVDLLPDVPATNPSAMSIDMSGISTQRFYRVFLLP